MKIRLFFDFFDIFISKKMHFLFFCGFLFSVLSGVFSEEARAANSASKIDPLQAIQGTWYATKYNVSIEIKGNKIYVLENSSKKPWANKLSLSPGLLIGRLDTYTERAKNTYFFDGQCWTLGNGQPGFHLADCKEALNVYYEERGKVPHWKFTNIAMDFLRKEQFETYMWKYRE